MKDFIISVLCAGVASGIIGIFFEDDAEIGKYVKLVLSLCVAAAIIPGSAALFARMELPEGIFSDGEEPDFAEIEKSYDRYVIEKARTEMCEKLETIIFQKTGIMPQSADIQFSITENKEKTEVEVSAVTVYVGDTADADKICALVESLVGVTPDIAVKKDGTEAEP